MPFDNDIVDQVRSSNDIVDVVSSYVPLKKIGARYRGLCPFHNEKTPSFYVNGSMKIFKCFGCGESGDVFSFIEKIENVGFYEALEILAKRAGITLPERKYDSEGAARRSLKESIAVINKEAATYYYMMLRGPKGTKAYEYLKNRGLSDDTMRNFGLGFAGNYSNGLYNYLKEKGHSDDELSKSGLFSMGEKGIYDKFWDRVIFPIMDVKGRVIAFGGRIMSKAENAPKYLNSPETELFLKSENLYGLHIAKKTKEKFFLLCEGYMDVIALHQAGFNNAVASLGTSLTERQAKKIKGYTDNVVITYDSDSPGKNAAKRAIPILKNEGLNVRILDMTPYKDPDELIVAKGADEYRKRIEQAVNGFDFEAKLLEESHDLEDPDSKTQFDHRIAETIARIDDPLARNNHINAAAKKYNIDAVELKRLVNSIGSALKIQEENEKIKTELKKTREIKPDAARKNTECLLLNTIIQYKNAYLAIKDVLKPDDFPDETEQKIYDFICKDYERTGSAVGAGIIDKFEEAEERKKVADILMVSGDFEDTNEDERRKAFADYVTAVKKAAIDRKAGEAMSAGDGERLKVLITEEDSLGSLRKKLLSIDLS
jgi:DNA primase